MKANAFVVEVPVSKANMRAVAVVGMDYFYEEFGGDTMEMAGVDRSEFLEAVINYAPFISLIRDLVREHGRNFFEYIDDYLDYYCLVNLPAGKALEKWVNEVDQMLKDADDAEDMDLQKMKKALSKRGYKVTKI